MGRVSHINTNFSAGELSDQLLGRVDVAKYFNGASSMQNLTIKSFGGAFRRPGTYYVAQVSASTKLTRVIPFQFSTEQAYIIELGDKYMRFYKDSGQIMNGASAYQITTPYDESDLFEIQFAQSADTMYIVHPDYYPRTLTRTGHTAWTLGYFNSEFGPYLPANSGVITMTPSATAGSVNLTASEAYFVAGHSGSLFRVGSGGYVKINSVASTTLATATVIETLDIATATTDWAEGAWNTKNGYPACVSFYEQRLFFAASSQEPQTIWGSVSDDYTDFTLGSNDDQALVYTLATNEVNAIRYLMAGKVLAIGTTGGVFIVYGGSLNEPLTPSNVVIKQESTYGSAQVLPKRIGNYVYYMQRNNRTLRELSYNYDTDNFRAADMTLLSEHITKSGIVDMDYQESPDNVLWCVRDDGQIACLTRQVDQEVAGWWRAVTDGIFESVAVIPNGEEDQVWVVVQRSVNGSNLRYVEYFKPFCMPDDQEDSFFVDSGLTYDGAAAQVMSGLSHLEGATVAILVDGATHPTRSVSAGSVTLNGSYSVVHIGLPYTSRLATLPLEHQSAMGTAQGLVKRIYHVFVRLYRSLGMNVGNASAVDVIPFRDSSMAMDEAVPLFSGVKKVDFNKGYNQDAQVVITQAQALPLNILSITSKVELADE